MISTQKLILTFVLVNIMVGIVDWTFYNPEDYITTPFDSWIDQMDELQESVEEEETVWGSVIGTVSQAVETTIINPLRLGYQLLRLFYKMFVPISIMVTEGMTKIEQVFVYGLFVFRSMLTALIGIELYLFFKNKKAT